MNLLRWIAAGVVGIHLGFLCWMGWVSSRDVVLSAPQQRLVVQTVSVKDPLPLMLAVVEEVPPPVPLPPEPSETSEFPEGFVPEEEPVEEVQPLPVVPLPPKPKPVEIRHPKEEQEKKPKWKTPVPHIDEKKEKPKTPSKVVGKKESVKAPAKQVAKKVETPKKNNDALQKLLASAEESIAKIDKNRDKGGAKASKAGMTVPGKIDKLQIDAITVGGDVLTGTEATYRDELSMKLRRLLRLPEFGDVKLKLTLERSGKIANVSVLSAQSSLNRTYIESTLPTLKFSDFGKNFSGQSQYTFVINLTNE